MKILKCEVISGITGNCLVNLEVFSEWVRACNASSSQGERPLGLMLHVDHGRGGGGRGGRGRGGNRRPAAAHANLRHCGGGRLKQEAAAASSSPGKLLLSAVLSSQWRRAAPESLKCFNFAYVNSIVLIVLGCLCLHTLLFSGRVAELYMHVCISDLHYTTSSTLPKVNVSKTDMTLISPHHVCNDLVPQSPCHWCFDSLRTNWMSPTRISISIENTKIHICFGNCCSFLFRLIL